jgi:hypothetical protein
VSAILGTGRDGRPVLYKDNPATRLAESVAEMNAGRGSRMGSRVVGVEVEGDGGAAMMNANLTEQGQGGVSFAAALSPQEQEERERRWAKLTGQKVGGLATDPNEAESEPGYASVEEVGPVLDGEHMSAKPVRMPRAMQSNPMYPGLPAPTPFAPRMADFKSLPTLDLEARTVTIGGSSFTLNDNDAYNIAKIAFRAVQDAMRRDLEEALARFNPAPVLRVPQGEATDGVLVPSNEGTSDGVPGVPEGAVSNGEVSGDSTEV